MTFLFSLFLLYVNSLSYLCFSSLISVSCWNISLWSWYKLFSLSIKVFFELSYSCYWLFNVIFNLDYSCLFFISSFLTLNLNSSNWVNNKFNLFSFSIVLSFISWLNLLDFSNSLLYSLIILFFIKLISVWYSFNLSLSVSNFFNNSLNYIIWLLQWVYSSFYLFSSSSILKVNFWNWQFIFS